MRTVLIVGATSAIAQETAKCFAKDGDALYLVGRNAARLNIVADDLRVRGASSVECFAADMDQTQHHGAMLRTIVGQAKTLDIAFIAYGSLPDQRMCEENFESAQAAFQTNCLSAISLLTHLARVLEQQKHGTIAVITSVAGDRGRRSNYVYGAAKGALGLFLSGLRARLHRSGVAVVNIKPGFVDTPMTAQCKKNFLYATPQAVGQGVYQAIIKKKDEVYLPGWWRWIMAVIRWMPVRLFKRFVQ